ncbi:glycosyltransferase family protein [Deminuibacter soli]|uniref:Glycosyltransferase family 2 protein n=1 Tax=Deminuibacter soli TaxID=2291815 RepID=A0A3E1NR98_9BACT|nr:hypothetical protein [Deminuibacter soli]RFM30462.1 hypothetical protein DXN05_05760 [Deminuibacter soli]
MNLAAVVILYHFGEDELANIQSYCDLVDKLYIFDNTEAVSPLAEKLMALPKVHFVHDFQNAGIAVRLNQGAEMAIRDGFTLLLTMDQDSYFEATTWRYYLQGIESYASKEQVAMFGTTYNDRDHAVVSTETPEPVDVRDEGLITSGAILNLALFKQIGGFDENLFIDSVDYDYCLRAHIQGLKLVRFQNIFLHHAIGNEVRRASIKSLFLVKKQKFLHSPLRCYYMYRNLLYMEKKFGKIAPASMVTLREGVMTYLKNFLLYGRRSRAMFRYLIAARRDFRENHMGRIRQEL